MPDVHPTALVGDGAQLAEDVVVGPYCVVNGAVSIGKGTRLIGHVQLEGPLVIGDRNLVYPFCCLGFAPQDFKWDPGRPGAGLRIGDGNTFREGVTISRATSDTSPTVVGDANLWMANSHAGHDCRIGNRCVFANGTLFAGHVEIGDGVVTGGNAVMHQFCRVGRGAMLSGLKGANRDIPPWFMLTGSNVAGSINLIGLRRSGMPSEDIDHVKWVYRALCRDEISKVAALERLRTRADVPIVAEYIAFVEASKRGIVDATADLRRV